MLRMTIALLLLAAALIGLGLTVRAQDTGEGEMPTPTETPACPPERLLVKVRPGADPAVVVGRHGGRIVETIPGIEVQVVEVPAGTGQQALDALNADPDVVYAERDEVVTIADEAGAPGCSPPGASPEPSR